MLNLSYTLTPKLRVNVESIDRIKSKIMNLVLSREKELRLSWQAKVARTYASLSMSGNQLPRSEMAKILTSNTEDSNKETQDVISYTHAQDYINQFWYVNEKPLNAKVIYKIYSIATRDRKVKSFKKYTKLIKQFLDYIEKGEDHPAIKAGIAQIELRLVSPFSKNNGRITRLISQLYLYKHGYDMRGFLALDEEWKNNLARFRQETDVAALDKSITGWLEFYTDALVEASQKALLMARDDRKVVGVPKKFWKITKRQRAILSFLENPDAALTNREAQKKFSISQVTAARDLTSLTKKGLIFRYGKGRSVKYTRV